MNYLINNLNINTNYEKEYVQFIMILIVFIVK